MAISIIFPIDMEGVLFNEGSVSLGATSFSDLSPSEAIKQNLKMLLLTRKGEYIMDSNFGVGLPEYLFETAVTIDFASIEQNIINQASTYMPYITIQNVSVSQGQDEMAMSVRIEFFYNEQPIPEVFELQVI